jgi:type I restriction enzyme S subunit
MNNIGNNGNLNLDLLRTGPRHLARENHYLRKEDLLICTTNSAKLVGKRAIFNKDGQFAFSNHLTRIRIRSQVADPKFIFYYLFFLWRKGELEALCKNWVNQSTIPKDKLPSISIPLPSV